MKCTYITNTIVAIFLGFVIAAFIVFTQTGCVNSAKERDAIVTDASGIPSLIERTGELAKADEWEKTKVKIAELKQKVIQKPKDVKPRLQIAMIYISEARVTGNADYYQYIDKILNDVIAIEPNNFEAFVFKASVAMSLHQFAMAETLADKARSINPDNAYVYGILVDANVEMGNYEEAIKMSDKMQDLKPSLEAYSRVSYLREIYGDYAGAIEAMKMAVQAGAPGLESTEWARVQLGDLYLNTGKPDEARTQYEMALQYRPEFPNAEIGLAKVEKAMKNYDGAIEHTKNAIRIVSEAAYVSQLGEMYELKGDKEKAKEVRNDVVRLLEDAEKEQGNVKLKHSANRELANAYLNAGELNKALIYAQKDLSIRPENIDANELAAWIEYLTGDISNAKIHADKMLRTNTSNATTLTRASLIYIKAGDAAKADALKQKANAVNSYVNQTTVMASL